MKRRDALIKSAVVSLVIGLIFPMAWIAFTGYTSRTPVIEKAASDKMTELQRQEWMAKNTKEVGFVEHISNIPDLITKHWAGYIQASVGIFLVVFVLNSAYLLRGSK